MSADEQAIRDLQAKWIRATIAGDLTSILSLMSEDAVFLTPGRPPMRREDFVAGFMSNLGLFRIEPVAQIQEIRVAGNIAWCWSHLSVSITPTNGAPVIRAGDALTILEKQIDGVWRLVRDANLLTVQ